MNDSGGPSFLDALDDYSLMGSKTYDNRGRKNSHPTKSMPKLKSLSVAKFSNARKKTTPYRMNDSE